MTDHTEAVAACTTRQYPTHLWSAAPYLFDAYDPNEPRDPHGQWTRGGEHWFERRRNDEYVYHGTTTEHLPGIRKEGLQSFLRNYFATDPKVAMNYGFRPNIHHPGEGKRPGILLRVHKQHVDPEAYAKGFRKDDDFWTGPAEILPDLIEARHEGVWKKLSELDAASVLDAYDPNEPRDPHGKWTKGGGSGASHPGTGYSAAASVDKKGVIHTTSVYDAQRALAEGREVELDQPRKVSVLIEHLGSAAAHMIERGDKAPDYNLCNVMIKGESLFCHEHKGIPRIKMPQLDKQQTKAFVAHLKELGYKVSKEKVRSDHLRATQEEMSGAKVAQVAEKLRTRFGGEVSKRLIVSKDDYVLDGHHHWAAKLGIDYADGTLKGDTPLKVSRINISITKLLKLANEFTGGKGAKGTGDAGFDPNEPRDPEGKWTTGGGGGGREETAGFAGTAQTETGAGSGGGRGGTQSPDAAQRSATQAARGHAPLIGLPTKALKVGGSYYVPGPLGAAKDAAERYMKAAGLPYDPPKTYAKLDKDRATRVAFEYNAMRHDPDNPQVKASYEALARETIAQWHEIQKTGLKVEWIKPGQADPYAETPRLAAMDVIENNHWWGFPTDIGYGSGDPETEAAKNTNPMLQLTDEVVDGKRLLVNDVFRIVHDYFGHFKEGNGFRAEGEENAWRSHSAMYSELARGAMTAETRGQNSWVNYGPYGEANRKASAGDTTYAPQKIGLMPEWTANEGRGDEPLGSPPADDKLLLITHDPNLEQLSRWFKELEEREHLIETEGRYGDREDSQIYQMKNALREYAAASDSDKQSDRIGISAIYGGPRDADGTKLLAVSLIRFNRMQKVARLTLTGGFDIDAQAKSLTELVERYGGSVERIEAAVFGDDQDTIIAYERAGFALTDKNSTGMYNMIYGKVKTEAEMQAERALKAAQHAEVEGQARICATALHFDPALVEFSDEDKTFELNGMQMHYAGSYTRGEAKVKIYHPYVNARTVVGVTAHEIGHRKLDMFRQKYLKEFDQVMADPGPPSNPEGHYWWEKKGGPAALMKPDGTLRAPYDKKYPTYENWTALTEVKRDKMIKDDGVSDYSREYWTGFQKGEITIDKCFHETIAEMSRIKYETGGNLPGSADWKKLFRLMEKNWEMTPPHVRMQPRPIEEPHW